MKSSGKWKVPAERQTAWGASPSAFEGGEAGTAYGILVPL